MKWVGDNSSAFDAQVSTASSPGQPEAMGASAGGPTSHRCAKCGLVNPHGTDICQECGAHLFLTCRLCGTTNERIAPDCVACGSPLHRPRLQRWQQKVHRRAWVFQLIGFMVGLAVLILLFLYSIK